jgi:hypothetical protein
MYQVDLASSGGENLLRFMLSPFTALSTGRTAGSRASERLGGPSPIDLIELNRLVSNGRGLAVRRIRRIIAGLARHHTDFKICNGLHSTFSSSRVHPLSMEKQASAIGDSSWTIGIAAARVADDRRGADSVAVPRGDRDV